MKWSQRKKKKVWARKGREKRKEGKSRKQVGSGWRKKKKTMNPKPCPGVGLGFIPSKKILRLGWDYLDGALVGAGSLKPDYMRIKHSTRLIRRFPLPEMNSLPSLINHGVQLTLLFVPGMGRRLDGGINCLQNVVFIWELCHVTMCCDMVLRVFFMCVPFLFAMNSHFHLCSKKQNKNKKNHRVSKCEQDPMH